MATALATAGLLAGIFGSTLAPVAQGASWAVTAAKLEIQSNFEQDWNDAYYSLVNAGHATGSATNPLDMYAPYTNDGGALGTDAIDDSYTVCSYIDETDIETLDGYNLSDSDDVSASVTATGGLLIYGDDNNAISYSTEEADYATSYTDNNVTNGLSFCLANADDDDAYDSVVTVKIQGVQVGQWNIRVYGPGQTMTLTDRTGGWIAMDNGTVDDALRITFLDKANHNLFTGLRQSSSVDGDAEALIEDYWLDGNEADSSDLMYAVDVTTNGSLFSDALDAYDALDEGSHYRDIDITDGIDSLCNSDRDSVGDTHTVYAVMDYGSGGEISSSDKKTNGIALKCSDDGYFAEITGWDFGTAKTVEQGDTIPMYLRVGDGSGNPMGLGGASTDFSGFAEINDGYPYFEELGDPVFAFGPSHVEVDDADYYVKNGASVEMEDASDGDTTCAPADNEDGSTWEENLDTESYMVAGDDNAGAGIVLMCYTASYLNEDLGVNWLRARSEYPWTDFATDYLDNAPKSFTTSITVVKPGVGTAAGFGTSVKVGKRTVSITGPVGAKITFVVENSAGVVRTYNRLVEADGKAKFRFKSRGTYDVYAMYGDSITGISTIKVQL
jgi:hypothetical protein